MTAPSIAPTSRVPEVATNPGSDIDEPAPEDFAPPAAVPVLPGAVPVALDAIALVNELETGVGVGVLPLMLTLMMLDALMTAPLPTLAVFTQLLLLGAACGGGVGPPPWWYVDVPYTPMGSPESATQCSKVPDS